MLRQTAFITAVFAWGAEEGGMAFLKAMEFLVLLYKCQQNLCVFVYASVPVRLTQ